MSKFFTKKVIAVSFFGKLLSVNLKILFFSHSAIVLCTFIHKREIFWTFSHWPTRNWQCSKI